MKIIDGIFKIGLLVLGFTAVGVYGYCKHYSNDKHYSDNRNNKDRDDNNRYVYCADLGVLDKRTGTVYWFRRGSGDIMNVQTIVLPTITPQDRLGTVPRPLTLDELFGPLPTGGQTKAFTVDELLGPEDHPDLNNTRKE